MRSAEVRPPAIQPAMLPVRSGDGGEIASRLRVIQAATLALLLALGTALGYWQLVRSADIAAAGRRQTLRRVVVPAPRGAIHDREHRVLAENRVRVAAAVNLGALRAEIQVERDAQAQRNGQESQDASGSIARARRAVVQRHLERVAAIVGRHVALDAAALERHFARDRTAPFVLVDDLNPQESNRLAVSLSPSDPVRLQRGFVRTYPNGNVASHVLGRLRREPTREPAGPHFLTLNVMDVTGDTGIEKQHETTLRGRAGGAIVRVDAAGFVIDPPLDAHAPAAGQDLILSLDLDLQLAAERSMAATPGGPRGAAVAVAVATGEILAMTSKPDFDLNAVSPRMSAATKRRIDAEGGWLNRATQALYPPGSSFKIFTVIAGLRAGTLQPQRVVYCPGYREVGGHRFVCHFPAGHGAMALRSGLAQSCNVFAYDTGLAAGAQALAAEVRRFHFGEPTGVDLPFETRGMLAPDPAWKIESGRGPWTVGDTVNMAIGQGFLAVSPLQAACAVASLARRETLTVPTLLRQPGRRASGDRPAEPLGLSDRDYAALIDAMQAVIEIGIGRNAQVPGVKMAGKSGTAQVERENGMMNVAWFVAFGPVDRPEIAIAVALEGDKPGEEFAGAAHAAPVVAEIAGTYFDKSAGR